MKTLIFTIILFYIQPSDKETTLLKNELSYWDKEYQKLLKITPHGLHERTEYDKSVEFYKQKRKLLISKIK